jgi:hypothetical protein
LGASHEGHRRTLWAGRHGRGLPQPGRAAGEDFAEADLVVDCLGDPGGEPSRVVAAKLDLPPAEYVTIEHLKRLFV